MHVPGKGAFARQASRSRANIALPIIVGLLVLLLGLLPSAAFAQQCPVTTGASADTYPSKPMIYPMTSNRYAVQYRSGNGDWIDARVYISTYGGTIASPYVKFSEYPPDTSMSFVSIPATAGGDVELRVTKLWAPDFPTIQHVSVRPRAKNIKVISVAGRTVQLSSTTAADFAGDQFILWWDGEKQGGGIEGLAFFLDPPYARPTGRNVKTIKAAADLNGDLSAIDTLDFEGAVAIGSTGAKAFVVPANINNVFLAPGAWVQGKLRFAADGTGRVKRLYGPGVLDSSRFGYMWRQCRNSTQHTDDGYPTVSWVPVAAAKTGSPARRDKFVVDGTVITDSDYYATDLFIDGTLNNVKIIGWNGNNDGLALGEGTRASNVFIRTGDDSLKVWGAAVAVTNATVWQNWNGAPVNLGWFNNSPGDDGLIDGLYVVKTDWRAPTTISWNSTTLSGSNNAVIASLMVPGTKFGAQHTPVYKNIYVEDPPRVLFSLKILPPDCALVGLAKCPPVDLSQPSVLNLDIENVHTPASIENNSIGFQNRAKGGPLPGTMNITMTNVMVTEPNGSVMILTQDNAASVGKIVTNGGHVNLDYKVASRQ